MEPIDYPIDGILDLHIFDPKDVKDLLPEYLRACREKGLEHVRIIHGKGKGILRKKVHRILDRQPFVVEYGLAGEDAGGWGATVVTLEVE